MSNIIPPLLSSSPPPMVGVLDEEDDDEFGDFAVATNISYGCDALSLPSSPQKSPKKTQSSPKRCHDSNSSEITDTGASKGVEKDFQDKRKNSVINSETIIASASESSAGQENHSESNVNNLLYNNGKIKPKSDNKYNTFQYFPEIPPDIVPDDEDEFEDVDNGYVEEFDEFQEFESAANVNNGSVLDKHFTISEESDIPDTDSTVNANPEPSLKVTEPVLNQSKPYTQNPELEGKNGKSDEDSIKVEENNLDVAKSPITNPINGEISAINEHITEGEIIERNSDNLQENVSDLPTQAFDQPNEHITSESDTINVSYTNDKVSKSEDIQVEHDISKVEESVTDKIKIPAPIDKQSSESEDDFGDFENHSFNNSNVPDIAEPPQLINHDQVPDLPTATQDLDDNPNTLSDDDFGDFETSLPEPKLQWESDPFSNNKNTDVDTNNFGDFDNQVFEETPQHNDDQEFGDFTAIEASKPVDSEEFGDFNAQAEASQSSSGEVTDDPKQLQRVFSLDIQNIPQRAQTIILEMFPVIKQTSEDYLEEDFTNSDVIFKGLGDVTDTCALLYQWSKSNSQNCFLRALNIDTRNILYGPRWNESMPRYAATLGYTPLEPVKSEVLTPTLAEPSSTTTTVATSSQTPSSDTVLPAPSEIPSAQFDWVGSGLTNPLENSPASTMLLDLEQLVASLDIQFSSTLSPKSPNSPSPVNDIDDWEFWLRLTPKKIIEKRDPTLKDSKIQEQNILQADFIKKTQEPDQKPIDFEFSSVLQPEIGAVLQTHSDSGSVKSLQLEVQPEEVINKPENNSPEFDDFTSFQSSSKIEEASNFSNWSFNAIPLRETHIANLQSEPSFVKPDRIGTNSDEPGWLKPTILTPDLPRKINVPEEPPREEEVEEFAEFQVSTPVVNSETAPTKPMVENIEPEIKPEPCVNPNSLSNTEDDDEFTDFQSTLPNSLNPSVLPTPAPPEPLQPAILEPLKPSLLQPMTSAAINWPDPGITDDDLIRIELNYKPKALNSDSEAAVEVEIKEKSESLSVNLVSQEESKTAEEDDWSDFVSSQGPLAPTTGHVTQLALKTSQLKQPSRTSTPELSLCIPQLNHIQPPKRPVPVITQQGLIQTKLPVEPLVQPSVQQSKTYPQVSHLQNGFQPSLISNQFAAQFGQGLGYQNIHQSRPPQMESPKQNRGLNNLQQDLYNSSKSPQYFLSKPPIASSKADEFDEEWTDFVSSQPAPPVNQPSVPNGLHGHPQPKINFDWNRPPQFTSWSANVTPNIITNPVSFDSFQSYSSPAQTDLLKNKSSNRKNPNVVMQPKKNTIPSISSVPDLEFIAPKSRTWKK